MQRKTKKPTAERLIDAANITDGCWEWVGSKTIDGYGSIGIHGKSETSHRVAYKTFVGPIPSGLYVLHHCDNRACIRPTHLYLGTHDDNMRDKKVRGRASNGGRPRKLSDAQVEEIKNSSSKQTILAQKFGVSQTTISQIKTGKTWIKRFEEAPKQNGV